MITVLIPAHNEADRVGATLDSLAEQTVRADRVIVVSDNSTDGTVSVAAEHGAETIETVGNTSKKAGALNQALGALLAGRLRSDDFVLVMDADTVLAPEWIETAQALMDERDDLGAVGAVFFGERNDTLLTQLQSNEYTRYAREIDLTGRVMVLSGTAAMIRATAMRQVAAARGSELPGTRGDVYDVHALTEDNELTLALKTLGWALESPIECSTRTELMPTLGDLWRQRLRWYRGALENLRAYGWTPVTRRYWGQQAMLAVGVTALSLYLTMTLLTLVLGGSLHLNPIGLGVTAVFLTERLVTVWRGGWKARGIAATLYVELAYEMFLQAVFIRAVLDVIMRREAKWHHVAPSTITS